jgi:hypothetical protein
MTDTPTTKPKKTKAEKAEKAARTAESGGSRLRGWTGASEGSMVVRTFTYDSVDQMNQAAKRAFGRIQKFGKPVELRLEGSSLTIRLPATNGAVEEDVKRLAKRLTPDDDARTAQKAARKAAADTDEQA